MTVLRSPDRMGLGDSGRSGCLVLLGCLGERPQALQERPVRCAMGADRAGDLGVEGRPSVPDYFAAWRDDGTEVKINDLQSVTAAVLAIRRTTRSLVARHAEPLHRCDELFAEVFAEREQLATRGRVEQPCGIRENPESTMAGGLDSEVA